MNPGRNAQRALLAVFAVAGAVTLFIAEDAREPNGPLPIDSRFLSISVDHRTPGLISAARWTSHLGDPAILLGLAAAATVWIWFRRRSVVEAFLPLVALLGAAAIEFTMKQVIGRPRPPLAYHLLHEADASFPSGHATGSTAFFVTLAIIAGLHLRTQWMRGLLIGGAAVVAALIGGSRVVLGVHWVTDITAGWFLGLACAAGVSLAATYIAEKPKGVHRPGVRVRAQSGCSPHRAEA